MKNRHPFPDRAKSVLLLTLKLCALGLAPVVVFALVGTTRTRFAPDRWPLEDRLAGEEIAGARERHRTLIGDQRVVEELYVARLAQPVDVLVVGSSAVRAVDGSLFPGRSFHNAWVPWGMIEDIAVSIDRYASANKLPGEVVLGLTPEMLLGVDQSELPCLTWTDFRDRYADARRRLGLPALAAPPGRHLAAETRMSLDGLQREVIAHLWPAPQHEQQPVALDPNRERIFPDDATVARELSRQQRQYKWVFDQFHAVDEERLALLQALVGYLRAHDVHVTLLLSPLRPDLYRQLSRYPLVASTERRIRAQMAAIGEPVAGSFDPQQTGCTAGQFDDGVHTRLPCVRTLLRVAQN
jgi:hypothetical protein